MPYDKNTWVNGRDISISADKLNHIEDELARLDPNTNISSTGRFLYGMVSPTALPTPAGGFQEGTFYDRYVL